MVNSAAGFIDRPKVMNGFSDFIVQVFGERGKHARAAVGMAELPMNLCVEIEVVVEVEPQLREQEGHDANEPPEKLRRPEIENRRPLRA
ncbi:MAG: RidA family protein [Acidobacteriota bacterium]